MEGDREGVRVEAPMRSLGEASVGRAGYAGGVRVFAYDEGLVHGNGESVPGGGGEDSEGEEGGPGPPWTVFFFRPSSVLLFLLVRKIGGAFFCSLFWLFLFSGLRALL